MQLTGPRSQSSFDDMNNVLLDPRHNDQGLVGMREKPYSPDTINKPGSKQSDIDEKAAEFELHSLQMTPTSIMKKLAQSTFTPNKNKKKSNARGKQDSLNSNADLRLVIQDSGEEESLAPYQ